VEGVVLNIIGVDEPDIALPFLCRDKDGFYSFEIFPCNEVAFNGGRNAA
jgi:hypothetical protein